MLKINCFIQNTVYICRSEFCDESSILYVQKFSFIFTRLVYYENLTGLFRNISTVCPRNCVHFYIISTMKIEIVGHTSSNQGKGKLLDKATKAPFQKTKY